MEVNHNRIKNYPFGYLGLDYLKDNGNLYLHSQLLTNNRIRVIECNIEEKWMILKEKNENDEEWLKINMNEIKKNDIIDLNEHGERWEGSSLESNPFGYGCIYNTDNNIIYQGFMFGRMKVCFGKEFYGDNGLIEYEGDYYRGMRYGNGKLYDKKGKLIYEGEWSNNHPLELSTLKIENELKEEDIHYGIKELEIGENCLRNVECFKLIGFNHLHKLVIKVNHSLYNMRSFCIEDCDELVDVTLGGSKESQFNNDKMNSIFSVKNCKSLQSLYIGDNWYMDCDCVELMSTR